MRLPGRMHVQPVTVMMIWHQPPRLVESSSLLDACVLATSMDVGCILRSFGIVLQVYAPAAKP
jgi:hypothetical protein